MLKRISAGTAVMMRASLGRAACALLFLSPVTLVLCRQDNTGYFAEDGYRDDAIDV